MNETTRSVPDPHRWRALALLCGAFFMVILDGTIVIVALPSIGAELGFAKEDLQWVLSAYALAFGGLLLLGGRAADLLGRRRVFMAGVGLFTAASLMCGVAWAPAALLAARVVQGVGAAIMTPTALSIISTTFTEGSEPPASATPPCRSARHSASRSFRPLPCPVRTTTRQLTEPRTRWSC
jgi:MFS family permease